MDRKNICEICKRVNKGELLEDICKEIGIQPVHMERMIKSENIKEDKELKIYYSESLESEARKINKIKNEKRCINVFNDIEKLWLRRYRGISDNYNGVMGDDDSWHDSGKKDVKIRLNGDLLLELEKKSQEEGTELSYYIEKLLLQMLEKNKRTYPPEKVNGRARRIYIKTMVEMCGCEDHIGEIEKNIKKKNFIKLKKFSYTDKSNDMDIYRINYLFNNGYSSKQIEEVLKENYLESETLEYHYNLIHSKKCKTFEESIAFIEKQDEINQISERACKTGTEFFFDI